MRYTKESLLQMMEERGYHISSGSEVVREISDIRIEFTHRNGMSQCAYEKQGSELYEPCFL